MDPQQQLAEELLSSSDQIQAMADEGLPKVTGRFGKQTLNALVSAANQALAAGGFGGDYPTFDSDLTELPVEFVRLLAMLADAAAESGAALQFDLAGVTDDRALANLAAKVSALSSDAAFKAAMAHESSNEGAEVEPAGEPDEEGLMMERM